MPADRPGRRDEKPAQDAPGATIVTSVDLQVPRISGLAYRQGKRSRLNVIEHFRAVEDDVDAAVPVDAKNAPTRDLENCKDRSFPQRPHRSRFLARRQKERRTNDKNSATQLSTKSDQVQRPQFSTASTSITFPCKKTKRTKNERQKQRNPTVHQIGSGPTSRAFFDADGQW